MCRSIFFFFSSRRRHTRLQGDWSSDVCSSDLDRRNGLAEPAEPLGMIGQVADHVEHKRQLHQLGGLELDRAQGKPSPGSVDLDRKSTRLNSSHLVISYAAFSLKKKEHNPRERI